MVNEPYPHYLMTGGSWECRVSARGQGGEQRSPEFPGNSVAVFREYTTSLQEHGGESWSPLGKDSA